jgi:hypothetical protein
MSSTFDLDMAGVIEGTDKASSFSRAWDYMRHYARLFERFRDEPINMIEIGVATGVSLNVWKSYFTRARIVGIDIAPACARFADDRVSIEIGSQDDPAFLAQVCAKYPPSIIIDDGSHRADHMIYTFERTFPSLLPGGIYVVEDIAFHFGPDAKKWQGPTEHSAPEYFLRIARSCMARSVQGEPDVGTAHYTTTHADCVEFVHSAVVVRKKADTQRDVAAALDFADEYLRERKPDAGVHERLGQFIINNSGPLDRAEAELKRAIEIGGETPVRLRFLSDIAMQFRRLPDAAALAERAAALGTDAYAWAHVGNLRFQQGDHAAAARAFRHAAAMQPGNTWFSVRLSEALEREGNVGEALAAARQALTSAAGTDQEKQMRARVEQLRAKSGE